MGKGKHRQQIARIVENRVILRDGAKTVPRPDERNSSQTRAFQIHLRVPDVYGVLQAIAPDDQAIVFPFAQPRAAWMFKIREIRRQPMRFKKRFDVSIHTVTDQEQGTKRAQGVKQLPNARKQKASATRAQNLALTAAGFLLEVLLIRRGKLQDGGQAVLERQLNLPTPWY